MSNKVSIWIYSLAIIGGLLNAYFAYKSGDGDVGYVWFISTGMACGALGAHLKIKELTNKDGEE